MTSLNRPKILVTGGAGFIGSHTVIELWNAGYEPVIIDNFSNSQRWIVDRVRQLTSADLRCYDIDCCIEKDLDHVFASEGKIQGIIHFAAYKSVNESVAFPDKYIDNNLGSLQTMINVKKKYGVPDFVFSSSATVYGASTELPVSETTARETAASPYGMTKQVGEDMINTQLETGAIILRYFNPIGAHPDGVLGELPNGVPQNLVPYITQTAAGIREQLYVYGTDYNTPDGTCIRDFIHVVDLAKAHVASLARLGKTRKTDIFNVGTGNGTSVKEAITAFEEATGMRLRVQYADRRPGDVEAMYANCQKANDLLGWKAEYSLQDAMIHAWRWERSLQKIAVAA